jgi:hypothetical protein
MLHRGHIIRDFFDILKGHARNRLILKQQQVGERGLGTFDLGRDQRLLANVQIEQESDVWQ